MKVDRIICHEASIPICLPFPYSGRVQSLGMGNYMFNQSKLVAPYYDKPRTKSFELDHLATLTLIEINDFHRFS